MAMFMYINFNKLFYAYFYFYFSCEMQGCQTSNFNDEVTYSIALAGMEEMHIDPDGVPYLFYTAYNRCWNRGAGGLKHPHFLRCLPSQQLPTKYLTKHAM